MSYYRMTSDLRIGNYNYPGIESAEIVSSWDALTDTLKLVIPRKLSFQGKTIASGDSVFNVGDSVRLSLGYDQQNKEVFTGYVARIAPGVPIAISLEDQAYLLKRKSITKSYKSVDLQTLLSDILPLPFTAINADLGQFRISAATPAQVLDELKKTYFLKSFFRNGRLYCGLAFWDELQNPVKYEFTFQRDIIESDLQYQRAEDVRLKVKAISINRDNTRSEITVGDPEGEERTLTYYNKSSKELKAAAERDLKRFRFDGYRGSFVTFGEPVINHGDVVALIDPDYPDRNGNYLVQEVTRSFLSSGYRQKLKLESRV